MGTDYGTANARSLDGLGYLLNAALSGTAIQFPQTIRYHNASSPFSIEATLGQWRIPEGDAGNCIEITIATGTLRDIDKGNFPLAGVVLTLLVDGQMTPVAVVNPGPLSELQQEGLLDAVSTYLNAPAIRYAIATVSLGSQVAVTLPGLFVVARDSTDAALLISGDLFLSRAVLPELTAPGLTAALGDCSLLSYAMSIVADKLVTTAQLGWTSSERIEQTFRARCSHSARFDAASRTLLFVSEDTNSSEPAVDGAVRALASAIAAASTKSITRVELSRLPEPPVTKPSSIKSSVASPVTATFHIHTAALAGAVYLQGNWS
jgi:hypothetical protein